MSLSLTPEEKSEALQALAISRGWRVLCSIFEEDFIAPLREELESTDFDDLAKVQIMQYKISAAKKIMDLPSSYGSNFTGGEDPLQTTLIENDPYEQMKEEEAKE